MKKTIYIIALLVSIAGFSQNDRFNAGIMKGKAMLKNADTTTAFQSTANYFERIKLNEPDQWLPGYYQAYALSIVAMSKSDVNEKENLLNTCLEIVQKASQIDRNSELLALEGYIQMMRLTVDPATRGRTLSPKIYQLFGEALGKDPQNPRAMLFMGQMEYGTAQFFGETTDKACGYIQKAIELLKAEPDEDTILPTWGMETTSYYKTNCNS